jgi:thiol-disulfide isomerase/thioredoxin
MSEGPEAGGRGGKPKGGVLTWALWGAALLGVAAVVYIIAQASTKPPPKAPSMAAATAFAQKVVRPEQPTPPPDYVFYDAAGKARKIADFKGKVVVMNIWATWCAPCVTEMPTLAKLQSAYAGKPVEVVAVSIDTESAATKASLFIAQHAPLKFYHDREMKLPFKLVPAAPGAPTTVIYGRNGLETARVAGEADWSSPEARALVDKALAAS